MVKNLEVVSSGSPLSRQENKTFGSTDLYAKANHLGNRLILGSQNTHAHKVAFLGAQHSQKRLPVSGYGRNVTCLGHFSGLNRCVLLSTCPPRTVASAVDVSSSDVDCWSE